MTCSARWNREIFTNIDIRAIFTTTTERRWVVGGEGGEREVSKKKKIPVFYIRVSFSFLSNVCRLCTYLCGLVHFSYLLLCISLWLRVSIYYEAVYPSTCSNRFLSLTSHEIRCFGSFQSSLLISAISSSLWAPSSPSSQISSHLAANWTEVNTFPQ